LAKASSVGAKTVNGPLPFKASTRSAASNAAVRVLKLFAATVVSTMSLAGFSAQHDPATDAIKNVANEKVLINFMAQFSCAIHAHTACPERRLPGFRP
jgi:hypothetical protein